MVVTKVTHVPQFSHSMVHTETVKGIIGQFFLLCYFNNFSSYFNKLLEHCYLLTIYNRNDFKLFSFILFTLLTFIYIIYLQWGRLLA